MKKRTELYAEKFNPFLYLSPYVFFSFSIYGQNVYREAVNITVVYQYLE